MALDPHRRAGLAQIKLKALVSRAFPHVIAEPQGFNAGAVVVQGNEAFVSVTADSPSPMAALLAWAHRSGATDLHLIVDEPDPVLTLAAAGLDPAPTLWQVDGVELIPMLSAPWPAAPEAPPAALAHVATLESAGCQVVVEHGVVIAEIRGVEVARVVIDADGGATVRVGVGLYDQEAHALMFADAPIEARLEQVVGEVLRHRAPGVGPHPLNLVARERWLRSSLMDEPGLVGLDTLAAVAPLVPRSGIREERPAASAGTRGAVDVLVVCATGISLDLVPYAAAHLAAGPADEVLLILPERDRHAVIDAMAERLRVPASLQSIPSPWDS